MQLVIPGTETQMKANVSLIALLLANLISNGLCSPGIVSEIQSAKSIVGDLTSSVKDLTTVASNAADIIGCVMCIVVPQPLCLANCASEYGVQLALETLKSTLLIMRQISKVCSVQKEDKNCGLVVNDCIEGLIEVPMKTCNPF